jgi:predicted signal transduction protein with EAL and GGDEF domain
MRGGDLQELAQDLYAVILSLFIFALLSAYLLSHVRQELRRRVAIEKRLEELALTDGLTGLLNRRALDEALQATWERCRRNLNSTFSVLFIDVDYFKLYNDSYGHKLGDEVLREVAGHRGKPATQYRLCRPLRRRRVCGAAGTD